MNCEQFRRAWVSDDETERATAEAHGLECGDCARIIDGDLDLARQIGEWKASSPEPPPELERRIAAALPRSTTGSGISPAGWIWATAAALMLGATVLVGTLFPAPESDSLETALRDADRIQHEYARAIARLEREADTVLDRATDTSLASHHASRLLAYRDRLNHLDSVIAEVQEFLDQNPGHSGGHTVLLAAYKEKNMVLREILDLRFGEPS